ncbi:MAG TPA: hypothetical protein VF677_08775, partial [Flavobacterium sp.]
MRGITGLGFVGPIAWICSTKRRGNEAVPLPPTLALSNHQLSCGWQNEGFTNNGAFSGFNHAANEMQNQHDLDALAKEKFGADYKKKYGVKSLKWGSQMRIGE